MDLKIEVKLRKLLQIFPQMKRLLENYLAKMKFRNIINPCKVATTKEKDFDENMLVVQI
jgi:hypothetical protein